MAWLRTGLCLLLLFLNVGLTWAQTRDTLVHHKLGEIIVEPDSIASFFHSTATIQRVGLAAIAKSDAASIDRVLRYVPGAHLQTNSRGETLVYLRGAGERQVAVFFDGALLNVPWDNRIDLGLVPAEVVGEITVVKGPPPVAYGTNVMGGALNLTARSLEYEGQHFNAAGLLGSYGVKQIRAQYLRRKGRWGYGVFSGYSERDGFGVPGRAEVPYGQPDADVRTNTHRRMFSNYGQLTYHPGGEARVGLSILTISGEKGIAPESHNDPQFARVRYWRYPSWHSTIFILSGHLPLGQRGVTLRTAAWANVFGQTIHQYQSVDYSALAKRQEDDDFTQGMRLLLFAPAGQGAITGAFSLLSSTHRQVDQEINDAALLRQKFRQNIYSAGAEYSRSGTVTFTLGASLDGVSTPETGDKPPRGPARTYSVMSGLSTEAIPGVRARVSVGRKVRFPTMRELFGEALGRFLVNPALGPEHSVLSEAGVMLERDGLLVELVGFFNRTYDTIDQRLVAVEGEEKPRRQRVNTHGSRVIGLESTLNAKIANGVSLQCNITSLYARGRTEAGRSTRLAEKPGALAQCTTAYTNPGGFSMETEYVLTGKAYGLTDSGTLAPLPKSNVVHARVGYLFMVKKWAPEVFVRVNNVTDSVTLPQLGLPGPGREIRGGMQVSF